MHRLVRASPVYRCLDADHAAATTMQTRRTQRRSWIPERSATRLREADLNVLSQLGNLGREDDLLDVLVQVARRPST